MSHGAYMQDVDTTDGYELTYESASTNETGRIQHQEVGDVITLIRDLHDEDWDGADIEATVTDFDGRELGEWHVEQEWLAALQAEELSETEFSQKVIETIRPVER
jgi:hypothetical protein